MMTFAELLEKKYLEWQSEQGKRKTLDEFAAYLGINRPVLSNWLSETRKPNAESLRLLSGKLGLEVYDVMGLPRPDESLAFLYNNWEQLPEAFRKKIQKDVEEYRRNEEYKRQRQPRTAKANS